MGYVAMVLVRMDVLDEIENDPGFGKRLVRAIHEASCDEPQDVSAHSKLGGIAHNAALVVGTTHMDNTMIVEVAGNTAKRLRGDELIATNDALIGVRKRKK